MSNIVEFWNKALIPYSHKNEVKTALEEICLLYTDLSIGVCPFKKGDGKLVQVLHLKGNINATQNGKNIRIPLGIFLFEDFPNSAPWCQVFPPNPNIKLKNTKNVDFMGRIYLPYLVKWKSHHNLTELFEHLVSILQTDIPFEIPKPQPPPPQKKLEDPPNLKRFDSSLYPKEKTLKEKVVEKITDELDEFQKKHQTEVDNLFQKQAELEQNYDNIKSLIAFFNTQAEEFQNISYVLNEKQKEFEKWSEEYLSKNFDSLDINELIIPQDELTRQLFETYAEDASIEEAIYYLDKALKNKVLDFNEYLDQIRSLTQKQFLAKYLQKKVLETQKKLYK
ncbi:tumor suppressor protein [Anaeramoeba ignava]|uniref:Tumor suppressor protein n=1 Tax=Anaeramoeba ignava TaxID=1746090 RepID=A0A9Q0LHR7_ANAIG|nr:tumor suppressor protein [Anaeramoeba ignava]